MAQLLSCLLLIAERMSHTIHAHVAGPAGVQCITVVVYSTLIVTQLVTYRINSSGCVLPLCVSTLLYNKKIV